MKFIPLDATMLSDKHTAHKYISDALNFPEHYGKNLDALADSLSEFSREKAIIVMNAGEASDYAKRIIDVLCEILEKTNRIFIIQ